MGTYVFMYIYKGHNGVRGVNDNGDVNDLTNRANITKILI
mgnify:FL=1